MPGPIQLLESATVGVAVGTAAADALAPTFESARQDAWLNHPVLVLPASVAASLRAQGLIGDAQAHNEGNRSGLSSGRVDALTALSLRAPGVGELLTLLRRAEEQPIDFTHGLRKNQLETQWDDAVKNLQWQRIPAPDLAYMVVRDLVPDPFGFGGPTGPDDTTISDTPQLNIDTLAEAAFDGWDPTRFEALVGRSGLAPAPGLSANAYFRNIINYGQYLTIIKKGDLRPAYANVILNASREILTAHDYAELQLRGYYDRATRLGNTAKHGMSDADSDLLFDVMGRGLSYHDVVKAKARGGVFNETPADIDPDILWALQRSNLRPEVYGLAWANRYSLPSAFVIKSLLTGGTISEAEGEQLYLDIGWPPDLAKLVATAEAKGTTARPKTATAAQLAEQYKAGTLAPGDYTTALQALGYTPAAADSVKASVDAAPLVAARTANLTKLRTYVAKGQLTDAQAATFLEAENVDPAIGTMLVAAWKREAAIEAAATTPPPA